MIDFTYCQEEYKKYYDGLNGKKKSIYYNNKLYMLKFPKENTSDKQHYASGTINEYISSNIFKILGFKTQDTLLGYYQDKIVVACKDFEHFENQLFSFGKIKNSVLEVNSSNSGSDTDLYETLHTIENQKAIPPTLLKQFFWKMFVADTLIANFDRHNGNWGFLSRKNSIDIAPIYDCGSSLYPKLNIDDIKRYLSHKGSFNDLMLNQTLSAITINGKKINPQDFLKNTKDKTLINAMQQVYTHIDIQKINFLIDSVEVISDTRKEFYKLVLENRKLFFKQVLAVHNSTSLSAREQLQAMPQHSAEKKAAAVAFLQTHTILKNNEIQKLKKITQREYEIFVDDVLSGDMQKLKKAQNIIYVADISHDLIHLLRIDKATKTYLRKNDLHHFRPERKAKYNQSVEKDIIKQLPLIVESAKVAYIDTEHKNFFLAKKLNANEVVTFHFNVDKFGNYIITTRKVLKDDLNKYQLVGSGIEPHIKRINNAALPTVPSPTNLDNHSTTIIKSQATHSKPKIRRNK